jgi:DNA-binding response OmpR family regulator
MALEAAIRRRYQRSEPVRVLLAEDDPDMLALMALVLRGEGLEVVEAADGNQALALLGAGGADGAERVDLVVADVRMPGCSGLDVLQRLRGAPGSPPVVLVTAFGDPETHVRARTLGAAVLVKPFELDDLRAIVFDVLDAR